MSFELSPSSYIQAYNNLSDLQKKIVQYLFYGEKKKRSSEWKQVYPGRVRIAKRVGCCLKTVSRFNKTIGDFLIVVRRRRKLLKHEEKGYDTNIYFMNKQFFKMLEWLESKGGFKADDRKLRYLYRLTQKMEQESLYGKTHSMSLPLPQICPIRKDLREDQRSTPYINPPIQERGLGDKEFLSGFTEAERAKAREDVQWYQQQGRRILNMKAFLIAQCGYHRSKLKRL